MIKSMKAIAAIMLTVAMMFVAGCKPEDDPNNGGNNGGGNNSGGEDIKEYTIDISANPSNGGTVNGGGSYIQGESCTVTATANYRYTFANWTEDGNEVSTDANYTFCVTGDRTLVANFIQQIYTISVTTVPDVAGTVAGDGDFHNGETCTLEATANDGFVFYYWSEDNEWISSDATYSFSVDRDRNIVAHFAISSGDGHAYVDLGLPSGTLWATCNVGANTSEEYGDKFAWGETITKTRFVWGNYEYCNDGDKHQLTKYCNDSNFGYNGFTDNLTTLLPEDDAATANWGEGWCTPTEEQWLELRQNTTIQRVTQDGVFVLGFTASNGNGLFLPTVEAQKYKVQEYICSYWSSSLSIYPKYAIGFWATATSSYNHVDVLFRCMGFAVRPVRSSR